MIALFTDSDSKLLAAIIPVLLVQLFGVWQNGKVRKDTRVAVEATKPNGGSSLRDAIDRLERMVGRLHERHDRLTERIYLIEDHVTRPRRDTDQ